MSAQLGAIASCERVSHRWRLHAVSPLEQPGVCALFEQLELPQVRREIVRGAELPDLRHAREQLADALAQRERLRKRPPAVQLCLERDLEVDCGSLSEEERGAG